MSFISEHRPPVYLELSDHRFELMIDVEGVTLPVKHRTWGDLGTLAWGKFRSLQWGRF